MPLRSSTFLVCALLVSPPSAWGMRDPHAVAPPEADRWVIRAGQEPRALDLVADVGYMRDLDGGYVISDVEIAKSSITYLFRRKSELPDGPVVGRVIVAPQVLARPGELTTRYSVVRSEVLTSDPKVASHVAAAVRSISRHDKVGLFVRLGGAIHYGLLETLGIRPFGAQSLFLCACLIALASQLIRRRREVRLAYRFKATHLLPAIIQTLIYCYWGLYWPGIRQHLPLILLQLGYAYLLDFTLSLTTTGKWEANFGPIPIVLSTNLFVQFPVERVYLSIAMITIGMVGKAFVRREGRHVFNPSAFGIAIIGLVNLAFPRLGDGDVSDELNLPPNMAEVMLILALLVQFRQQVVLVSLSAFIALSMQWFLGFAFFAPSWPAVLLVLLLVATDPATIPRTATGRILYGFTLGILMATFARLLEWNGLSDFYGKMIPVPIVNALSPLFDKGAEQIPAMVRAWFRPAWNPVHVGVWLVLVGLTLQHGAKRHSFTPELHAYYDTPGIKRSASGGIDCEGNPVFCRPFSFAGEARLWLTPGS